MKQGSAHHSREGTKREPIAHRVSETWASQIGCAQPSRSQIRDMYEGRIDNKNPPSKMTTHHCGSQGRHK